MNEKKKLTDQELLTGRVPSLLISRSSSTLINRSQSEPVVRKQKKSKKKPKLLPPPTRNNSPIRDEIVYSTDLPKHKHKVTARTPSQNALPHNTQRYVASSIYTNVDPNAETDTELSQRSDSDPTKIDNGTDSKSPNRLARSQSKSGSKDEKHSNNNTQIKNDAKDSKSDDDESQKITQIKNIANDCALMCDKLSQDMKSKDDNVVNAVDTNVDTTDNTSNNKELSDISNKNDNAMDETKMQVRKKRKNRRILKSVPLRKKLKTSTNTTSSSKVYDVDDIRLLSADCEECYVHWSGTSEDENSWIPVSYLVGKKLMADYQKVKFWVIQYQNDNNEWVNMSSETQLEFEKGMDMWLDSDDWPLPLSHTYTSTQKDTFTYDVTFSKDLPWKQQNIDSNKIRSIRRIPDLYHS